MDGPITVLHVEDEPDYADLVKEFLEREDERFEVVIETQARAGLDRLKSNGIDCIVSDYNMPEMNGLAFLEAVRGPFPDVPFILFTGKGSEAIASEAISRGVTDYLQKGGGGNNMRCWRTGFATALTATALSTNSNGAASL